MRSTQLIVLFGALCVLGLIAEVVPAEACEDKGFILNGKSVLTCSKLIARYGNNKVAACSESFVSNICCKTCKEVKRDEIIDMLRELIDKEDPKQ